MIEIIECEQLSDEWWAARMGCVTASEFKSVMAKGEGKTRRAYMMKLLGEKLTGEPADHYSNGHMERGHTMEGEARNLYAFLKDAEPRSVGFIRNGEIGCSPDSLIGDDGMLEIKTRLPHLQLEVLLAGELPSENKAQVYGQLWVAEREWCDFVSYWPKLPLFVKRVYRDEKYIALIAREVAIFLEEMKATEFSIRQLDGSASVMDALKAGLDAGGHPLPAVMP